MKIDMEGALAPRRATPPVSWPPRTPHQVEGRPPQTVPPEAGYSARGDSGSLRNGTTLRPGTPPERSLAAPPLSLLSGGSLREGTPRRAESPLDAARRRVRGSRDPGLWAGHRSCHMLDPSMPMTALVSHRRARVAAQPDRDAAASATSTPSRTSCSWRQPSACSASARTAANSYTSLSLCFLLAAVACLAIRRSRRGRAVNAVRIIG